MTIPYLYYNYNVLLGIYDLYVFFTIIMAQFLIDEQKELKRLGALELDQLIKEIPPAYRRRINLWLVKYSVGTRLF